MANMRHLRREMKKLRRKGLKWQEIADQYGVTVGMAYRIAVDGHEPKDAHIRVRLGLPAMGTAPVCERCGVVHVSSRCPKTQAGHKRIFDMSKKALRKALEEREEL